MKPLSPFVLFDLDDTIINFDGVGGQCWQEVCQEYAPRLAVSAEQLFGAIQEARGWYWSDPERARRARLALVDSRREIVKLAFAGLGLPDTPLCLELADTYSVRREAVVCLFEGAIECLQRFQAQGVRMGLITNGGRASQRGKIERFGLAPFFEVILIEGEFGIGKPDPRIFREALKVLGAAAEETWMVGNDLKHDIRPALELGMRAAWVDALNRGLPAESGVVPTRVIRSVAEL